MTTPPSRPRIPSQRGLWIGSLFLVLAGLFGMHGLADHRPCDMPVMPGTLTGQIALPDAVAGSKLGPLSAHAAHGITTATTTTSAAAAMLEDVGHVALATGGHSHGPVPDTVGLCLAILTGALLALALSTRRSAVRLTIPVGRRSVIPRALGRDLDPPSLTWLSIRRC